MNQKAMKNVGAALVLVVLFSVALSSLPIQRVMATMSISISPQNGVVGDTIRVNGTIDTSDGFFTVRWNQTLNVTTGQAAGLNANTSFIVPSTAGALSGRNVTVELIDDTTSSVATANFTLYTKFDMQVQTPPPPKQLQEGSTTSILVNVTGGESNTIYAANITVKNPANQTHSVIAAISNTTSIGSGDSVKTYPTDFVAAHTNYTGNYFVSSNVTAVVKEFFIGVTDKSEYRRNETVQVKAVGYVPAEVVTVDIKNGASSVANFPTNLAANSTGVIVLSWKVPLNATPGTYTVSITNTTSGGTLKTPSDTQDFEVLGVICRIKAKNLAGESVAGAMVEVYNATTSNMLLMKGNTNSTGWVRFNLDDGNYAFKAFVKNVEVGSLLNQTVTVDSDFELQLRLVNVVATVETEAGFSFPKERVPFVDISLNYSYTTRDSQIVSETASMRTNLTGVAEVKNLFTNIAYRVEAKRYDAVFNSTTLTVKALPVSPLPLHFSLPTYTLDVHVLDSKGLGASGVQINVYEWSAGVATPFQSLETSSSGDASFMLPFGRYLLRTYSGDFFLNETVANLVENPLDFTFNLVTVNVDVTVSVLDYFGQPLANANVMIDHKIGQEYVFAYSQVSGADGSTTFTSIVGGDSRISAYVGGGLTGVATQLLGAGSNQVVIRADEYVVVLGYPVETGLFALFSFILVLVVAVLVFARRRLIKVLGKRLKR